MRTGDLVISTGIFRSQCVCGTAQELRRGQECPTCPTCGADTTWAFQRGTYRAGATPAEGTPPRAEHRESPRQQAP